MHYNNHLAGVRGRVDWSSVLTGRADLLALPNVPPRPLVPAGLECVPDLSEGVQQGAEHSVWWAGSGEEGEDT